MDAMPSPQQTNRGRTGTGQPNPIDVFVGSRLRLRRTLMGISQVALAKALGLTFQQVQKYERGVNRIGASRLYDLAQVLGVGIDYFYQEMSPEVEAASPRHQAAANCGADPRSPDIMTNRETLDLVRAYYRIQDPDVRRRVHKLAKTLAGLGS
jgi:transcriptional regulator with XRE-family HTH domain